MKWEELARPESLSAGTMLFCRVMESPQWVAQEKVNGTRCMFEWNGSGWKATSRHGQDMGRQVGRDEGRSLFLLRDACVLDCELYHGKLYAFDLLERKGVDMRGEQLSSRLTLLYHLVDGIDGIVVVPMRRTEKFKFYEECLQRGAEGIVVKNMLAPYPPCNGAVWLKVKT